MPWIGIMLTTPPLMVKDDPRRIAQPTPALSAKVIEYRSFPGNPQFDMPPLSVKMPSSKLIEGTR
jgi:hypothetical protein